MVTDTTFFGIRTTTFPSDTIDTLDFTFMAQLIKSLELALLEIPPVSGIPGSRTRQHRLDHAVRNWGNLF